MNEEFKRALKLLRDLADLQNGPPLEKYRKQWDETMELVYNFLATYENELEHNNSRAIPNHHAGNCQRYG